MSARYIKDKKGGENKMINFLKGKKSYIMAIALFCYAVGGIVTGHLSVFDALGLFIGSGTVASLRAAISKLE
jgi:hypothetical protein